MYYDGFVRSTNAKLCLALFYHIYLDNSILSALLDVCFLLSAVRLLFINVYMIVQVWRTAGVYKH